MVQYKYRKIEDWIKAEIRSGRLHGGDRIPTESELMDQFAVSRQTVRLAITHLEREKLVHRIQGSGTYLSDDVQAGQKEPRDADSNKTVTMIMTEPNSYIFPEIMNGASDVLSRNGYLLNVRFTDTRYNVEYEILSELMENPPAGLIIEPLNFGILSCNTPLYQTLTSKIPSIMIHVQKGMFCPVLDLNGREGERKMAEYLIRNGHREIGMIIRTSEVTGQTRFLGYLDALQANHIAYDPDRVVWSMRNSIDDLFEENGSRSLEKMLQRVTAVLCHDDRIAFKLIAYLQNRGVRVPEDVSVAGYDDSFFSTLSYQITTVTHPKYQYGQNAAYALLDLIRSGKVNMADYEIPPRLIVRKTVAKRAAKNSQA